MDKKSFEEHGYLLLKQLFPKASLKQWISEVEKWEDRPGKWMKYYEHADKEKQLCRIENFLPYHEGFKSIIESDKVFSILQGLMNEPATLFKEKINFKYPGGSGFKAHQDAPAFTTFGHDYHITMMVCLDDSTVENGCLEIVKSGFHKKGILPQEKDLTLSEKLESELNWTPMEMKCGDVLFFDSYIPHRSKPNKSQQPRKVMYITYNKKSQGNFREAYFKDKREKFPPECERVIGKKYESSTLYNLGKPPKINGGKLLNFLNLIDIETLTIIL